MNICSVVNYATGDVNAEYNILVIMVVVAIISLLALLAIFIVPKFLKKKNSTKNRNSGEDIEEEKSQEDENS